MERFKAAFKPVEPIVFHPFNAIIGKNGAGKSTVLEALQWIDTAIRSDISKACDRYNGVHDLINSRSRQRPLTFKIDLSWITDEQSSPSVHYSLKVGEMPDRRTPVIYAEDLTFSIRGRNHAIVSTNQDTRQRVFSLAPGDILPFAFRANLLMGAAISRETKGEVGQYLAALSDFWRHSVFLRLSPNELAKNSPISVPSTDPMLSETGRTLPALLKRFDRNQLRALITSISGILPNFADIRVSDPIIPQGELYFALGETMPSRGRHGEKQFEVPAWMLSEGTRRITAILAVLKHQPPPTFLCIEEIENGLDPWSVISILQELKSASEDGIQIAFTTHSPWLLDHVMYDDIIHVERSRGDTLYKRFADLDEVKAYQGRVPPGAIYADLRG